MDTLRLLIAMFCAVAISQAIFMASYLIISKQAYKQSNYLLAGLLLALALRISKSLSYYLISSAPDFMVGLGLTGKLAIGPFLWLHIYSLTLKEKQISKWHYLHFIIPVFAFSLVWFFPSSYVVGGYYVGTWLLLPYLLFAWWKFKQHQMEGFIVHSKWVLSVLIGGTIIWLTFLIQYFARGIEMYILGTALACIVLYSLFMEALLYPDLLKIKFSQKSKKKVNAQTQEEILSKLKMAFEQEKIYRNADLSLNKLSQKLKKPAYLISKTINSHYSMSFREFVNAHRIAEVKEKLCEKKANFSKVEALAYDVGFNSPSAFYTAFKKETSLSPQEYRRQQVSVKNA